MDLIDRTNLPRTVTFCSETEHDIGFEEGMQFIIDEINDAPTVDAVPVVRCKDCKHRCTDNFEPPKDKYGDADYACPCICRDSYYTWIPDDDFFCVNGELKDGKHE